MWERNIYQLPPVHTPTVYRTHNLCVSPDWKSNLQPFGVQDDAPANWATWPGLVKDIFSNVKNVFDSLVWWNFSNQGQGNEHYRDGCYGALRCQRARHRVRVTVPKALYFLGRRLFTAGDLGAVCGQPWELCLPLPKHSFTHATQIEPEQTRLLSPLPLSFFCCHHPQCFNWTGTYKG